MAFRKRARGRTQQKPGTMNKTEQAYAAHLKTLQLAGEIEWFGFETFKMRLAKRTTYTPDFIVMRNDGSLEAHEVKGHWEDDAKCKIKVAAELIPLRFIAIKARAKSFGGGWEVEEFER